MGTATVKVYVMIDENGDHIASHDTENLKEVYENNIRDLDGTFGVRIVELTLTVPLPKPIQVEVTVPESDETPAVSVKELGNHRIVATASSREEKEYFGQGWSHYPTEFKVTANGVRYHLSVYNTPNHTQVNWSLYDADMPLDGAGRAEWPWNETWRLFALTPDESRELAGELKLDIESWLVGALEACQTDTTAETMGKTDNVVALPNFHASRAGD